MIKSWGAYYTWWRVSPLDMEIFYFIKWCVPSLQAGKKKINNWRANTGTWLLPVKHMQIINKKRVTCTDRFVTRVTWCTRKSTDIVLFVERTIACKHNGRIIAMHTVRTWMCVNIKGAVTKLMHTPWKNAYNCATGTIKPILSQLIAHQKWLCRRDWVIN